MGLRGPPWCQVKGSDSLSHLCRQVGSPQAHMGLGGSVTFNSEISQLSIGLTFSLSHFGQVSFAMVLPVSFPASEFHSAAPAFSCYMAVSLSA